jgi:hypothetical protein
MPASELKYPDLLLYWSPDSSGSAGAISANATLLGAFEAGGSYRLPENWQRGSLLLYSSANHELVDAMSFDKHP